MEQFENMTESLAPVWEKVKGSLAGPNPATDTPDEAGRVAGFWLGFWHGSIAPITFVASFFTDKAHVFEVHNNGKGYVLGFILGVMSIWGGGGRAGAMRR